MTASSELFTLTEKAENKNILMDLKKLIAHLMREINSKFRGYDAFLKKNSRQLSVIIIKINGDEVTKNLIDQT